MGSKDVVKLKRSCQNCKWYYLDERIDDERGKHVCYGHTFIATALHFADSVDNENSCEKFEHSKGETHEQKKEAWFSRWFFPDETVEMLYDLVSEDDDGN